MNNNRTLTISWEEVINSLECNKSQKEKLYKRVVEYDGFDEKDYYINWVDDKIQGIILKQPLEGISVTINLE